MAKLTSSALPTPTPTLFFLSPIITTTRKVSFLPPFTTFVTRFTSTIFSSNFNFDKRTLIFLRKFFEGLFFVPPSRFQEGLLRFVVFSIVFNKFIQI